MAKAFKSNQKLKLPPTHDWRTTDTDEINKRRQRAREEKFAILNTDPRHPVFSNFCVKSASGLTYLVEIRDLNARRSVCNCVDFRINGLGFCKHIEAVTLYLRARHRRLIRSTQATASNRIEVTVDPATDTLCVLASQKALPRSVGKWFDTCGRLPNPDTSGEAALDALRQLSNTDIPQIRLSQEIEPWLENRRRTAERRQLRHEYEVKVQSGEWPAARNDRAPVSLPARRHVASGLHRTGPARGRDGPRQDHSGDCRLRTPAPPGQGAPGAGGHPRFTQDRMGGTNPQIHHPGSAACLRREDAPPPTLLRGPGHAVLHHRQLRTNGCRCARCQRASRAGHCRARRSPADQELEHQDRAGRQAPPQSLCVRPHRHAHREPDRRTAFADGLPQSRRAWPTLPLQPRFLRAGRARAARRLPQPRRVARANQALHAAPPQKRGGDRTARKRRIAITSSR